MTRLEAAPLQNEASSEYPQAAKRTLQGPAPRRRCVQALDHSGHVVLFNHKRQINLGSSLRDHTDLQCRKARRKRGPRCPGSRANFRRPGRRWPYALRTSRLPVSPDPRPVPGSTRSIHRQRHADFGSGDHVHGHLWRSNASKIALRNPWASSMRGAATFTIVIRFLAAMALKMFLQCGARAVILRAFTGRISGIQHVDGNVFLDRGQHVAGCRTFAPKYASSAASSN